MFLAQLSTWLSSSKSDRCVFANFASPQLSCVSEDFSNMGLLKDLVEGKSVAMLEVGVVKVLGPGIAIIGGEGKKATGLLVAQNPKDHAALKSTSVKIIKPALVKVNPVVIKVHEKFRLMASKKVFDIKVGQPFKLISPFFSLISL